MFVFLSVLSFVCVYACMYVCVICLFVCVCTELHLGGGRKGATAPLGDFVPSCRGIKYYV